MRVSAGYLGQYRTDAWVPVRVTLRNTTGSDIRGTVEIPDSLSPNGSGGFQGPPQPYSARYEMAVVLPAGAQKRVTL
jgi:hypothetical protein